VRRREGPEEAAGDAEEEQDVRHDEQLVILAAVQWWEGHRPLAYTLEKHIENPQVNCPNEPAQALAQAVADYLKSGRCPTCPGTKGLHKMSCARAGAKRVSLPAHVDEQTGRVQVTLPTRKESEE
jgi:hypothetical protein